MSWEQRYGLHVGHSMIFTHCSTYIGMCKGDLWSRPSNSMVSTHCSTCTAAMYKGSMPEYILICSLLLWGKCNLLHIMSYCFTFLCISTHNSHFERDKVRNFNCLLFCGDHLSRLPCTSGNIPVEHFICTLHNSKLKQSSSTVLFSIFQVLLTTLLLMYNNVVSSTC